MRCAKCGVPAEGYCGGVEEGPMEAIFTPVQPVPFCGSCHKALHAMTLMERLLPPVGLIVGNHPADWN